VFARRAPNAQDRRDYVVPHSAITYVLDPEGRYVTHFTDAVAEGDMIERLRSFLV
jgi:protein SCO1/2